MGQVTLQLDILQNAFPTLIPLQKQNNSPNKQKKTKKKYHKKNHKNRQTNKKNRTIVPTIGQKRQKKNNFVFFFR